MNWKRWKNSPKKNERLLLKLVALGGLVKVLPSGRRVGRMVAKEVVHRKKLSPWQFQVDEKTGCWNWLRIKNGGGYGRFFWKGKSMAHRIFYTHLAGEIPKGLTMDHLCRNRMCVNPSHLEPVTMKENVVYRGQGISALNARKTHCKRGHKFDEENTHFEADFSRRCRKCRRWREKAIRSLKNRKEGEK